MGMRKRGRLGMQRLLALTVAVALLPSVGSAQLVRRDTLIDVEPGIHVFVREVRDTGARERGGPVLLLHGARVPGVASFDLPVPGGSLAADLAAAGHTVYVMDARGYGGSTRPPEMDAPPDANPPLVRSSEVVRDVAAVVEWITRRTGIERVALLGWATGGHWLGYYATLHPARVSRLILYNTLYAGSAAHARLGHGSGLEDPAAPGRFNTAAFGAWRLSTAASLLAGWDASIPVADASQWRDPAVAAAYVATALASDPTSAARSPAAFRAPSGAMEDSYYLATGRQLWDASLIRAPTLIVASELDFWSRPEDRALLAQHVVHAPVQVVVLPRATHFAHLDRPERGRALLLQTVLDFLR